MDENRKLMSHDDQAADDEAVRAFATALWDQGVLTWGDAVDTARKAVAAGLAVVRVGEPPPWMKPETIRCLTCGKFQALPKKRTALVQFIHDYFCDDPRERTLYRLTEGNDRD